MPHHFFYMIAVADTGLYYRTGKKNKGHKARGDGTRRGPKRQSSSVVEAASATHYPSEDYAEQAVTGILEAKGHSYEELRHYLGREPQEEDLIIEPFRALRA